VAKQWPRTGERRDRGVAKGLVRSGTTRKAKAVARDVRGCRGAVRSLGAIAAPSLLLRGRAAVWRQCCGSVRTSTVGAGARFARRSEKCGDEVASGALLFEHDYVVDRRYGALYSRGNELVANRDGAVKGDGRCSAASANRAVCRLISTRPGRCSSRVMIARSRPLRRRERRERPLLIG
jgi:hypothetical protein